MTTFAPSNLAIPQITWDYAPHYESSGPVSAQSIPNRSTTWVLQMSGVCLIGILAALVMSAVDVSVRRAGVVKRHPGQRPANDVVIPLRRVRVMRYGRYAPLPPLVPSHSSSQHVLTALGTPFN